MCVTTRFDAAPIQIVKSLPYTVMKEQISNKWPRQESNLYLELRKLLYYPLYYEANYFIIYHF